MEKVRDEVFQIVDEMYNDLVHKDIESGILSVLLTAAKHLNKNDMPPQIVAIKTVNGILIWTISGRNYIGKENSKRIRRLMELSRTGGYKWGPPGIGSLGVNF